MIIHDTLAALGLERREVDIYLALLRLGPTSIRDVAEAAGINRGTTHELLKALRDKGLVSYSPRGKRRHFCAQPPDVLNRLMATRQTELDEASTRLAQDIVPDLAAMVPDSATAHVHHYEGDDGIEFVLRDILATVSAQADPYYRVYSSRLIRKYLYRPFPNFTRQRVSQGIHVRVIAIGEGGEDAPLAERKWIPADAIDPAASYVAIYPPRCAFISLVRGDYPTAVILDSAAIASVQQIAFDNLWNRL